MSSYMTSAQWLGQEEAPTHFPKPNLHQKKVTVTVWWSAASLIHYSFLNPIKSEKYVQQISEKHWKLQCLQLVLVNRMGPVLLHDNAWPHIAQPVLQKMSKLGYEGLPQFSSVTQSCPTLCDPLDHSKPGLPVLHQFSELAQTHVHQLTRWCHPAISSSVIPFSCLQSSSALRSFQMSQLFASGGQSIGVLASISVFPMNTQDWSPLGWTGWISLQSKGLSRVFSNTTVHKHQFFSA